MTAPEPSDIRWEWLHVPRLTRAVQEGGTYLASAAVLVASFFVLTALKRTQRSAPDEDASLTSRGRLIAAFSALFIVSRACGERGRAPRPRHGSHHALRPVDQSTRPSRAS